MESKISILNLSEADLRQIIRSELKSLLADSLKQEPKEKMLSKQDIADYFHVTLQSVHNWQKEGKIIPIRIGRRVFFKESDIIKLTEG